MYSKYINNIELRESPREHIVGGVSLPMFVNISSEVLGGGRNCEGLNKISHLSVPIGLVITTHSSKTSSYAIPHQTKIMYASEEDNNAAIDEQLFHKLYDQTTYKTTKTATSKKRQTRRRNKRRS